jgi:hypothetical protein
MRFALYFAILLNLASWASFHALHRDVASLISETDQVVDGNVQAGVTAVGAYAIVAIAWGLALIALAIALVIGLRERPWPRVLLALACAVQAAPLALFFIATH